MPGVVLRNIRKSFGSVDVIKGIDLSILSGEFAVFVGPSGCGKSTLLRMIAGLEDVTSGVLEIDDVDVVDVPAAKRGIAMVFQSYALYPHMTVRRNLGFALETARISKSEIAAKVAEVASVLQIEHLLDRKPAALSGGQRQRVAIGRALVRSPKVFLFDEPLSNLDADLRTEMRAEIARLHKSLSATMIYVTHDQTEAMTLADRIFVLNDGIVEQIGQPDELYESPANHFVAGFIGSPRMNFADADLVETPSSASTIGVRPEALTFDITDAGAQSRFSLPATVERIEGLGHEYLVYLRLPNSAIWTQRRPRNDGPPSVGTSGTLTWPETATHFFDVRGNSLVTSTEGELR